MHEESLMSPLRFAYFIIFLKDSLVFYIFDMLSYVYTNCPTDDCTKRRAFSKVTFAAGCC